MVEGHSYMTSCKTLSSMLVEPVFEHLNCGHEIDKKSSGNNFIVVADDERLSKLWDQRVYAHVTVASSWDAIQVECTQHLKFNIHSEYSSLQPWSRCHALTMTSQIKLA